MIRAIVGSGGKTTIIKKLAEMFVSQGKKVFITTSTHMYNGAGTVVSCDAGEIIEKMESLGSVIAGTDLGEKIGPLPYEIYEEVCRHADEVLIEADGSKHMPLKYPAAWEPVIYDNADEITVVYGMHGLGMKARDVVFRCDLAAREMSVKPDDIIDASHVKELIMKGYIRPLKEKYPDKKINIGCIIMASGISRRFGENKLLAEIGGRTLIERILDATDGDCFDERIVMTRSPEVEEICRLRGIKAVLHELPGRNDAIRLAVEIMEGSADVDGCIFCPCDQPLLRKETIEKIAGSFSDAGCGIHRLSFEGEPGAPVLFGREFFEELKELPEKQGGSWLIERYKDEVVLIEASDASELMDADTKSDLEALKKMM